MLRGEHDLATIPLLDQQTRHVWPQCTVAVIDLSEVTFMSSSLIHWLLRVERALEGAHAVTLSVVTGPPSGVVATRSCRPLPVPTPCGSRSARTQTQEITELWRRPAHW